MNDNDRSVTFIVFLVIIPILCIAAIKFITNMMNEIAKALDAFARISIAFVNATWGTILVCAEKRMKKSSSTGYKIAIYIRVSTDEQAENPEGSIKNQEERLRDYVKQRNTDSCFGEIVQVFNDPGFSAKDTNRPAFQRMLSMIRSSEVDLVLVTEISRLTRSTKDFALLWDFLKEHGCQFQSLRDNFDTWSAVA